LVGGILKLCGGAEDGIYFFKFNVGLKAYYRAMYYSAKRGIAIVGRPSVRLSICDVGGSGPHRLEILETFAGTISPTSSLFLIQRPST